MKLPNPTGLFRELFDSMEEQVKSDPRKNQIIKMLYI